MAIPPITVLIDTYNHERFVEQALVSVLEQEALAGDAEILVVDDGSTDRTPELVREFAPRVRHLYKTNGGQASAFNAGIPGAPAVSSLYNPTTFVVAGHNVKSIQRSRTRASRLSSTAEPANWRARYRAAFWGWRERRWGALGSVIRRITLLPSTWAARVMVSRETAVFRGSSKRSSCDRLV